MMKELAPVGILFNFTWDELSPLHGVDPQIKSNTIREVGPEHFTLSRDSGEPLYTDSLGPPGSGADTLDGMLLHDARVIRDGLLGD